MTGTALPRGAAILVLGPSAMGLARRMGATISLSSVPGDGTLALLRLSAQQAQKSEV